MPVKNALAAPHETFGLVQNDSGQDESDVLLAADAVDPGSSDPTYLRKGLILGRRTATGEYVAWDQAAGDGSQNLAYAKILLYDVQVDGVNTHRATAVRGGRYNLNLLLFATVASETAYDAAPPSHLYSEPVF